MIMFETDQILKTEYYKYKQFHEIWFQNELIKTMYTLLDITRRYSIT